MNDVYCCENGRKNKACSFFLETSSGVLELWGCICLGIESEWSGYSEAGIYSGEKTFSRMFKHREMGFYLELVVFQICGGLRCPLRGGQIIGVSLVGEEM